MPGDLATRTVPPERRNISITPDSWAEHSPELIRPELLHPTAMVIVLRVERSLTLLLALPREQ
eukprot:scaffold613592_cov47-Prasinocladus_malaysianus.AAC.1